MILGFGFSIYSYQLPAAAPPPPGGNSFSDGFSDGFG